MELPPAAAGAECRAGIEPREDDTDRRFHCAAADGARVRPEMISTRLVTGGGAHRVVPTNVGHAAFLFSRCLRLAILTRSRNSA